MISNRLAAISASVVVLLTILVGLFILGSPTQERYRRLDEQRIADLQMLYSAVNANFAISKSLTTNLGSIQDGTRLRQIPRDPVSDSMYDYEPVTTDTYRLCADFSGESDEARLEDFWTHSKGRQCFLFNAQSAY